MKVNKKKLIVILIFIVIILLCWLHIKTKIITQDDIIFFQLFSRGRTEVKQENKEEAENIYLKVDYKDINFKNVNLLNVTNKLYRKIAPGTKRRVFNYIIFKYRFKLSFEVQKYKFKT